ncbi:MAG: peptidylprolyl isomerase [Patescibacteria group bacterium]|nr:peptidylprolyl isomerase [Patescibacteria group bacterium]
MQKAAIIFLIFGALALSGCGEPVEYNIPENNNDTTMQNAQTYFFPGRLADEEIKNKVVVIGTAKGDIAFELYADEAPLTVSNFIYLAKAGFYNDLTFHRVEPGFVVQGGDPSGNGTGGPGYTVPAEIVPTLKHVKGAVAMARLPDQVNPEKASSGSQFYITLDETSFLDGQYTIFGKVIDGMAVVEKIQIGDKITSIKIQDKESN